MHAGAGCPVKERPILFSGAMVRALLDGSKTQTRRVVKPQFEREPVDVVDGVPSWDAPTNYDGEVQMNTTHGKPCPYGVPGDRLWVRESFWGCDMPGFGDQPCVVYEDEWHGKEYRAAEVRPYARRFGHIPGIHMPRDASRILLEVVDVRVEQLQDISDMDAEAEGVRCETADPMFFHIPTERTVYDFAADWPRDSYRQLWDSLNAARGYGWDVNPYVWVVEFRVM
jgi:hypothetical protein